jgi:aspartate racemase
MLCDKKKFRLVGILGGMGPLATADFYQKIITETRAEFDQEHLPVIIHAVPQIPDRSEYLIRGGASPAPAMILGARNLEHMGAELLVIPCNTAHYWHKEISDSVGIPVLHVVEATLQEIKNTAITPRMVGLLGTLGTLKGGLYQKHLQELDIEWIHPTETEMLGLVTNGINAVKAGNLSRGTSLLTEAADSLVERGASAVVLACTEIPMALRNYKSVPYFDTSLILAKATIQAATL